MCIRDRPIITPKIIAKVKPCITSLPSKKIAKSTTIVVPAVFMVRDRVALIASFIFCFNGRLGNSILYSRILSKITTVSLIE